MKNVKKVIFQLPEFILVASILFYWYFTSTLLNPIAIILIITLLLQIILKNRVLGIIIASFLILASSYMILALMSELNKFTSFNSNAKKILFVGLPYLIITASSAIMMIYKNSSKTRKLNN